MTKKNPSARSAVLLSFASPVIVITDPTGGGVVVETVIVEGLVPVQLVVTLVATRSVPGVS